MIKKYQVTLFCPSGEYKPVACIVNYNQAVDLDLTQDKASRVDIQKKGVIKICQKRYWNKSDLVKYNYTRCKIRAVE